MGCKDPREFAQRAGLIRVRERHLADEPAEAPGSEGKCLSSGPYHGQSLLGAGRKGLIIEVDADDPATPCHHLLELGAAPATHVYDTGRRDRKSTRLNSSHVRISYAVFCLKKKK